jgi:chorismate mutase
LGVVTADKLSAGWIGCSRDRRWGVAVRAVRGAIQVDADERQAILDATTELLAAVLDRNSLAPEDLISVVFTATPDLTSEFPAYAARQMGITDVPLLCAGEIPVPGAMPRVLRLLAHVETERPRAEVRHVYLGGAAQLRTDLPQ